MATIEIPLDTTYKADQLFTDGQWLPMTDQLPAEIVVGIIKRHKVLTVWSPSIFQYGTMFIVDMDGRQVRLYTRNYGPSETYLSM